MFPLKQQQQQTLYTVMDMEDTQNLKKKKSLCFQEKTSHSPKRNWFSKEAKWAKYWYEWYDMLNIAVLEDSSNLCAEWLNEVGKPVGSSHARMGAIRDGGQRNIKGEKGGRERTDPTIRKYVLWIRIIVFPKFFPDHRSSWGFFHHHCQEHSEGRAEGNTPSRTKDINSYKWKMWQKVGR